MTQARTLGISLIWLVAGEGALHQDASASGYDEQHSSEKITSHRTANRHRGHDAVSDRAIDTQRLNTAVQILQSELSVTHSQLSLSENADLIARLYEILGPHGSYVDPLAMVMFNRSLSERIYMARETARAAMTDRGWEARGASRPPSQNTIRAVPHMTFLVCPAVHANFAALSLFGSSCRRSSYEHLDHLPDYGSFQY